MADADSPVPSVAVSFTRKDKQRVVGAAVFKQIPRAGMDDEKQYCLELYEFLDSEQFSSLDAFFVQMGACKLYLSDDLEDTTRGDGRKISNMLYGKADDVDCKFVKKALFAKNSAGKDELNATLLGLVGKATHNLNVAESQVPQGFACLDCLLHSLKLSASNEYRGKFILNICNISSFMRLDSAAAEAVNLLPKADHPSQFGSLFGVLNRCKTKMGARLLERWLRQPLLDPEAINKRLDIVEILKDNTFARNTLAEGPLKSSPDLDAVLAKMQRKSGGAGLSEVYRLYVFTRTLPDLVTSLTSLVEQCEAAAAEAPGAADVTSKMATFRERFIQPITAIADKFAMFQQLVEHVIDMDQLPDFFISPKHDPELAELSKEKDEMQSKAERILHEARNNWASFADVKLESSNVHAFFLRATKADDERQIRANKSSVRILSIQKNGVHFTTPELERLADRCVRIDEEYARLQSTLVDKTVQTAATYLPVAEAASALVAELDVLCSFATAAALCPSEYVRPKMLPRGQGVMNLVGARHPCVELMDDVNFIPNDYTLKRGESSFQILTGPNMGGKSTYIRGIGSIVTMAQVGSFVPCTSAEFSVVDSILARVGAGDAVQKGVSTFMAEMLEASVILQTATRDSLIIVDELGRGTSTFDGFGIAWAISEYLITRTDCLCLFATHFHELTALSRQHPSVINKHVSAYTNAGQVVMLYNVKEGPCSQSFGIHIAVTADFPKEVIAEAKRKAAELEHVGTDLTSEEGKAKHHRMMEALGSFGGMDVENLSSQEVAGQLRAIFVPEV